MNPVIIMPSIRQPNLEYLEPLGDTPVIVIDDANGSIPRDIAPHIQVTNANLWHEAASEVAWLIPQKNPACKNLGLYDAWFLGHDTIILLDDDCDCRVEPEFLYKININRTSTTHRVSTPHNWYNPMGLLGETSMWSRGFPYEYRHEPTPLLRDPYFGEQVRPMFNEGLWTGTPDINGIDKFVTDNVTAERTCGFTQVALTRGQYLPLSIMNVQLHRDLIPAFYQPPDYSLPGGHRIRRHDDVWSFLFLKTLMDVRGDVATVGRPIVWHRKEGDRIQETLSEHGSNLIQRDLYDTIQNMVDRITPASYAEMAVEAGHLMRKYNRGRGIFHDIISDYAKRIVAWAELFI